jgi:hypothetical protein
VTVSTTAIDDYRELLYPSPADDGYVQRAQCARLVNGLNAIAGHCRICDSRIRESRPREYRIRDYAGRVITADRVN